MYYGAYKNIRNSAWQCILDFKIHKLPINITDIAQASGIKVVRDSGLNVLLPDEGGKTYFDGQDWIIVYNDKTPTELSRFTIAHELGHIFLGHEMKYIKYSEQREFSTAARSEQEADMFAFRLLCPACVLWGLDISSPQEISKYCKIPLSLSKLRSDRMKLLYKRNKFLSSSLEREVFSNFEEYLSEQKLSLKSNQKSIDI